MTQTQATDAGRGGGGGMMRTLRRAVALLDRRSRRRYALAVPAALIVMVLELVGFIALAAVVQVLTTPSLLTTAGPRSLIGLAQNVVDAQSPTGFVATVGAFAVGLLIARGVFASIVAWWQAGVLARAEAVLSTRLFRTFLSADYGFHLEHHSADLTRTVAQSVRSLMGRVLLPGAAVVIEGALIVGLGAALFIMEPAPALTSMTTLGLAMAGYLAVVRRKARRIGIEDEQLNAADQRIIQEGLGAVKVLTILERRSHVIARFDTSRHRHAQTLRGLLFMSNFSRYYLEAVVLVMAATIAAAALSGGQAAALGSIGVILAGSMRLLPSVQRMMTALNTIRVGAGSIDTIERDLLLANSSTPEQPRSTPPAPVPFRRHIEFRDLAYRYPSAAAPALHDINLTIRYGESVGIVGTSGSGKTTLVDVLTGLLPPSAGGLYVDGTQITRANLPSWRAQIGYVPQETIIVDDTVRRNVALGLDDADIDDRAVWRALEQAQLQDLVKALPEGLDSRLGERGVRMSGGQRQRIGIARALYHHPRVLVLDEATAALDSGTESQIVSTIERLHGAVTIIMIAHRLSTIERCDLRVRLEHGRIETVRARSAVQPPHQHALPEVPATG
ncbi:ABC transporter ATP-binding protein [Micromonospora fiedleri]|uniref:ABC transporter ATP-binding protein n=1 Tax=Micromonospora fiedleri TaxID=1157498 RepID=A0ABS1UT03_9ACTN|nr:ABC transporter ATP-binding protein [Micromonospora fiedleri]MBL6279498.1 ABC transporter ATP-binding protein [Micromonospora fiedleri]